MWGATRHPNRAAVQRLWLVTAISTSTIDGERNAQDESSPPKQLVLKELSDDFQCHFWLIIEDKVPGIFDDFEARILKKG